MVKKQAQKKTLNKKERNQKIRKAVSNVNDELTSRKAMTLQEAIKNISRREKINFSTLESWFKDPKRVSTLPIDVRKRVYKIRDKHLVMPTQERVQLIGLIGLLNKGLTMKEIKKVRDSEIMPNVEYRLVRKAVKEMEKAKVPKTQIREELKKFGFKVSILNRVIEESFKG